MPYPDAISAMKEALSPVADRGEEPIGASSGFVMVLDGTWRFLLAQSPEETPQSWELPDFDDQSWSNLTIPGAWSLQGHGKPHYTNIKMPFDAIPPGVPATNPCGLHRRRFCLPKEWSGRRIVLRLGSAESFVALWVNGREIGWSKDSRLPADFDITSALQDGDNQLAVQVIQFSDASYIEDQDQWWLGGLHRSVLLYTTGEVWMDDLDFRPASLDWTGEAHPGRLKAIARLAGASKAGYHVRFELTGPDGKLPTPLAPGGSIVGASLMGGLLDSTVRVRD